MPYGTPGYIRVVDFRPRHIAASLEQMAATCPRQLGRVSGRKGAKGRDADAAEARQAESAQILDSAKACEHPQVDATMCDGSAGVAQLVEHQPSKLNVASSSLVARFFARRRQTLPPGVLSCQVDARHEAYETAVQGLFA